MEHINAGNGQDIWNLLGPQWNLEESTRERMEIFYLDKQAINWDTVPIIRRDFKLRRYQQYQSPFDVYQVPENEIQPRPLVTQRMDFFNILNHVQIRNAPQDLTDHKLVWSTTDFDVYLATEYRIHRWSNQTHTGHIALNLAEGGDIVEGIMPQRIKSFAVGSGLIVVVGQEGQLVCKNIATGIVTPLLNPHGVAKAVEIYHPPGGQPRLMITNTNENVVEFDVGALEALDVHEFPWEVNHVSVSPNGHLMTVVGNNIRGRLFYLTAGQDAERLTGHLDYYHASAWHIDGNMFATGNQDRSCRVWDARNIRCPLYVLKGKIGAINAIRFDSTGRFMAMAESVDFVHVYDVSRGFEDRQEIDFFGKSSGISFSPSARSLFVGISPCPNQDTSFITYNIIPEVFAGGRGHEPKDDDEVRIRRSVALLA